MINGNLDQFLDTGWFSEAELYYKKHVYWCEAIYDETKKMHLFVVDKWLAENEDNKFYHSVIDDKGAIDWSRTYEDSDKDLELIKKRFLEAPIFEGKTFWQVESDIAWLEESNPIKI